MIYAYYKDGDWLLKVRTYEDAMYVYAQVYKSGNHGEAKKWLILAKRIEGMIGGMV
jgi:hypothetical protein